VDIIRAAFIEIFEESETPIVPGSQSKCHPGWNLFVLFFNASLPWFTGFAVECHRPSDLASHRVGVPKYEGASKNGGYSCCVTRHLLGGNSPLSEVLRFGKEVTHDCGEGS
jgi:hypothetical protein